MWICPKCGNRCEGRFCPKCGTSCLEVPLEKSVSNHQSSNNKKPLIIGIIAAAVVIIAGMITVLSLNHNDKEEKIASTGVYYYASPEKNSRINLYYEADEASAVLTSLESGAPMELVGGAPGGFLHVYDINDDLYGYVKSEDVSTTLEKTTNMEKVLGTYYVTGVKDTLSLKEAPDVNANIIKNLKNGDSVSLIEMTDDEYWYVSEDNNGKRGYVLKNYLTSNINEVKNNNSSSSDNNASKPAAAQETTPPPASRQIIDNCYVSGTRNYLAIRSQPSASENVEIGKTYNGNKVGIIEKTNGTFWYIYDYSSGVYGYVKCAYLSYGSPSYTGSQYYYVSGTTNYLALRSDPRDGEQYEIGKFYNGDTVKVLEKTNGTFWYVCNVNETAYGYVKCAYLVR